MSGLVSVKSLAKATQFRDFIRKKDNKMLSSFLQRIPSSSPFTLRAIFSKTPPAIDSSLDNPNLGPFLLKLARNAFASSDDPDKALDYASNASILFERCLVSGLELTMSLHVLAAIYCSLGRFEEAVLVEDTLPSTPFTSFSVAASKLDAFLELMRLRMRRESCRHGEIDEFDWSGIRPGQVH